MSRAIRRFKLSEVIKLKKHPYTGKDWSHVTINGIPFLEYLVNTPIDPIHLMHQMVIVSDEQPSSCDDQCIQRLMEYFSYTTHPICQIYADNRLCRIRLLEFIGFPVGDNVSFSDFVEDLIGHLISFPPTDRVLVRQQVYRYLETCQIFV